MMVDVIKAVISLIKPVCPSVYFGNSPVKYPKVDCDLRQINALADTNSFRLTLDIWANNGNYAETLNIADNILSALTFQKGKINGGYMTVYEGGNRYSTPEKDNDKIVHLTDVYEIYFYKGQED